MNGRTKSCIEINAAQAATNSRASHLLCSMRIMVLTILSDRIGAWHPRNCALGQDYSSVLRRVYRFQSLRSGNRVLSGDFVLFAMHKPKFLQLVPKCVPADIEQLGGVGLVAGGLAHGQLHHRSLHLFKRGAALGNV
jgi:hypothetical protein